MQHTSNLYYTEPCAILAKMLCERTGMKKVFFGNSGAEANECAIKVARKYSADKKGPDCFTIVTLINSFHGRTLTMLSATGQDHYHELFQPLTPGFVHTPANDFEALKKPSNTIAGIMIECVQGEGGVVPLLMKDFVKGRWRSLRRRARHSCSSLTKCRPGTAAPAQLYAYMNYGLTRISFPRPRGSAAVCRWVPA